MFLKKLSNFFLELFFPKKCLNCGKNGIYLCQSCLNKIEISQNNICPFCDRPVPNGLICEKCKERYFLDKLIWATPYSSVLIKELIKIFKYRYIKELAHPLSQLLIKSLTRRARLSLKHNALVVAVPLHKQRIRERDFNQAELLAKEVAEYFSLPLNANVLIRKKYTPPQAKTKNHKARRKSLENTFEISPEFTKRCVAENKNLLKEKTIVLVDDVFTSGATLSEAAKVLKQAGAKKIWGLTVAKG